MDDTNNANINDALETNASPKAKKKKGGSFVQLIKFALVGASNTLVDMIVNTLLTYLLKLVFSGEWIVYAAKTVGYICGLLNSYFWNSRWTFREERKKDLREKISFVAVNLLVLLISFGLIRLFSGPLGLDDWWTGLSLPEWLVKIVDGKLFCSLLATCVCIPVNFILNKLFVFTGGKKRKD